MKQDATLVCNAFGDQPISIVWRKVVGVDDNGALNVKFQGSRQIHSNAERFSIVEANSSTGLMTSLTIRLKFFLSKSFTLSFPER